MIATTRTTETTARPTVAELSEEKNARCAGQSARVLRPSRCLVESVDRRGPAESSLGGSSPSSPQA
jgi:hypothetical protein